MKNPGDKKYLDECMAKFKELGLNADYEKSYHFGEGSYDIFFKNGGYTFETMQISWTNAETAIEEWGEEEGEDCGAAWQLADEMGHGLLTEEGDNYHTENFQDILDALVRVIGSPVLFETDTVDGLRAYLEHLIKLGKGTYKVTDYKGTGLEQRFIRVNDDYDEILINARLESFTRDY